MKSIKTLTLVALFFATTILSIDLNAQLDLPRGSQNASVTQTVGTSKIYINYSRPNVNGREVWGNLVPYGMNNLGFGTATESPWRAGANENTIIKFTDDVTIEGQAISAGKYGLHVIVNEDEKATVIFSKNNSSWGSFFYDPSEDALRVDVSTKSGPHVEQLRFDFEDVTANSATAVLKWEKKQIPFKIGVEVTNVVMADIRKKLQSQTGFQRQTWEQAAGFALNNGGDLNEALRWVDAAISGQFFSEQNFNNTTIKANILRKQGKNAEADALLEAYVPNMTILETHQYGRQLIAQGNKERALEVFKLNAKNNKGTWPVDYGLARGYSAMGNYKTALKHAKIAHSRVPDQPNRTALELNIKKLEQGEDIN